ncbi:MAG: HPr family phosphocarrier protein [Elusimicrobiota bacterium]
MIKKKIQILNKLGVHARPAALLVETANKYKSSIKVSKDTMQVDAKSIMGIMMLAAEAGSELEFIIDGDDEIEAMNALEALINSHFDE